MWEKIPNSKLRKEGIIPSCIWGAVNTHLLSLLSYHLYSSSFLDVCKIHCYINQTLHIPSGYLRKAALSVEPGETSHRLQPASHPAPGKTPLCRGHRFISFYPKMLLECGAFRQICPVWVLRMRWCQSHVAFLLGQWYFRIGTLYRALGLCHLKAPCLWEASAALLILHVTWPHHTYPEPIHLRVPQASISSPSLFRQKCPGISDWKMLYEIVVLWRAMELSESLSVEFVKPNTAFNGKLSLYRETP